MTPAQSEFARAQRRKFYRALHLAVGTPQHGKALGRGFAWPASVDGVEIAYNHVIVLPYHGGFNTGDEMVIPRIAVNWMDRRIFAVPMSTKRRWIPEHLTPNIVRFFRSPIALELTCTIGQLPDFAGWIVAYLDAQAVGDLARLPRAPHRLEDVPALTDQGYVWSVSASAEYAKRRALYESRLSAIQRARGVVQAETAVVPGFVGSPSPRQNGRTPRGTVAKIESLCCLPVQGAK